MNVQLRLAKEMQILFSWNTKIKHSLIGQLQLLIERIIKDSFESTCYRRQVLNAAIYGKIYIH